MDEQGQIDYQADIATSMNKALISLLGMQGALTLASASAAVAFSAAFLAF